MSGGATSGAEPRRREAVDVVLRLYEAINRGRLGQLLERLDRGVEFHPLPLIATKRCRGHGAVRRWWGELERSGLDPKIEVDETRASDEGDRVLAAGSVEAAGVRASFVGIHVVREGKITALRHYFSDVETVRKAGVAE